MSPSLSIILFCFIAFSLKAQSPGQDPFIQMEKRMEKMRREMDKVMKEAFGNSEDINKMLESFQNDFFNNGVDPFQGQNPNDIFKNFRDLRLDSGMKYKWLETSTEIIFEFDVQTTKDRPINIEINKDKIKISGETEIINKEIINGKIIDSKSISNFKREFSTPKHVDVDKAKVEKSKTGYKIIFPKLKVNSKHKKAVKSLNKGPVI